MPDQRHHRGPHPEDGALFASDAWPGLCDATFDLSWLLSRRYSLVSAVKLVGDRFQLRERQRLAVMRCACSDDSLRLRQQRCVSFEECSGQSLSLDGYNVLTSVEAVLGGGVILQARDGCYRDMASMHGTYRKVAETLPALQLLGDFLSKHEVRKCTWYLDSPVSNSGRLKTIILELATRMAWDWQVELVHDPDAVLAECGGLIATADSVILDRCERWLNLVREVITSCVPDARVIKMFSESR